MKRRASVPASAFLALALAAPLMAGPPAEANNRKTVTMMTRNLYFGVDLLPAIAAVAGGDPTEIITAISTM